MYVTQELACTVQNSNTPITPAQIAAGAARVAAQDTVQGQLLQKWITMLDRTPESFAALGIAPSQFVQPQSAVEMLNLDRHSNLATTMSAFRSGAVCNPPAGDGPLVVPLNGYGDALPLNEPVDLLAKGPLGRPQNTGMSGYRDLQPAVVAQRVAARRRRMPRQGHTHGLSGCHCGGSCGPCKTGLGDVADGSAVMWGSLAAAGFLMYMAFAKKGRR